MFATISRWSRVRILRETGSGPPCNRLAAERAKYAPHIGIWQPVWAGLRVREIHVLPQSSLNTYAKNVNFFSMFLKVAHLLGCTSWSGAGPGLMDAATQGALEAGKPVGGFKIGKEAGEWAATNFHPYLPSESYLTCRFFSARKHGLVDAAVRSSNREKTAVIVLPGGIGTLDEAFEILALIQLERIGSALPVPFILMNYDSFYSKLLEFLDVCEDWGTVSKGEVSSLWKVCNNNSEALGYLAKFYDLAPANQK